MTSRMRLPCTRSDERPGKDAPHVKDRACANVAGCEAKRQQTPGASHNGKPRTAHRGCRHENHQPEFDTDKKAECFAPHTQKQHDRLPESLDVMAHGCIRKVDDDNNENPVIKMQNAGLSRRFATNEAAMTSLKPAMRVHRYSNQQMKSSLIEVCFGALANKYFDCRAGIVTRLANRRH